MQLTLTAKARWTDVTFARCILRPVRTVRCVKTFHLAITSQSPRNHLAITSLTEPPVLPPLQGKRSVSAPPRTAAKAEQHTEALKDCLGAVSTAFTAREVPPPSCYFFFSNGSLLSSYSCCLGSSLTPALRSWIVERCLVAVAYQKHASTTPTSGI